MHSSPIIMLSLKFILILVLCFFRHFLLHIFHYFFPPLLSLLFRILQSHTDHYSISYHSVLVSFHLTYAASHSFVTNLPALVFCHLISDILPISLSPILDPLSPFLSFPIILSFMALSRTFGSLALYLRLVFRLTCVSLIFSSYPPAYSPQVTRLPLHLTAPVTHITPHCIN